MLFKKIIRSIVGETLRGLPLQPTAGAHIGTPLHHDIFIEWIAFFLRI